MSSLDAPPVGSSQSGDVSRVEDSLTGTLAPIVALRDRNPTLETVSNGTSDYDDESHARRCRH